MRDGYAHGLSRVAGAALSLTSLLAVWSLSVAEAADEGTKWEYGRLQAAVDPDGTLAGTHVLFMGDSLTRYQYLSLVYGLEYGEWPGDSPSFAPSELHGARPLINPTYEKFVPLPVREYLHSDWMRQINGRMWHAQQSFTNAAVPQSTLPWLSRQPPHFYQLGSSCA